MLRSFAAKAGGPNNYISPDLGETKLEEVKTKIHKIGDVPSWYFKFDDGKYHILRTLSDERYLLMQGVVLPRYAGSAYYALERDGVMFHVYNADRMVIYLMTSPTEESATLLPSSSSARINQDTRMILRTKETSVLFLMPKKCSWPKRR